VTLRATSLLLPRLEATRLTAPEVSEALLRVAAGCGLVLAGRAGEVDKCLAAIAAAREECLAAFGPLKGSEVGGHAIMVAVPMASSRAAAAARLLGSTSIFGCKEAPPMAVEQGKADRGAEGGSSAPPLPAQEGAPQWVYKGPGAGTLPPGLSLTSNPAAAASAVLGKVCNLLVETVQQ